MKSTVIALVFLLSVASHAFAAPVQLPALVRQGASCMVNICFVIDRSTVLPKANFDAQKEFVLLVSATSAFDPGFKFGAYSYGPGVGVVKGLSSNIDQFLVSIEGVQQAAPNAGGTGLPAAIDGCASAFQAVNSSANIIVVSGGGATATAEKNSAVASASAAQTAGASIFAVPATTAVRPFFQSLAGTAGTVIDAEDFLVFDTALRSAIGTACT